MTDRFKLFSAVHLFLIKDNKILLLRRHNTGYEDGNYSVPAGHVDGEERVTAAMSREAFEEAGIVVLPTDLQLIHVMHRKTDNERIDFFFIAKVWTGEIKIAELEKCDDLRFFPLDGLPKNVIPYVRHVIDCYKKGSMYSEFGWES